MPCVGGFWCLQAIQRKFKVRTPVYRPRVLCLFERKRNARGIHYVCGRASDQASGHVTRIQIRATTIQTRDRKELLVPNKEFITGRLLNWSLSDQVTRIVIAIGVAYGSDVDQAMVLITEAAQENPHVLPDPPPFTGFEGFGDNSLNLNLRCFIDSIEYRLSTISELHQTINRKLNAAGIVIAYPQRDLHLDTTSPLDIRIRHDDGAQGAGQG